MKQRKFFLIFVIMVCVCTTACTEKKLELDGNDFRIETKEVLNCSEEIYTKHTIELKKEFVSSFIKRDEVIIIIDDDPLLLREYQNMDANLVLLKDTVLVD